MRSRILTATGVSATALAVAFSFSGSAGAAGHSVGVAGKSVTHHAKPGQINAKCPSQRDNDNGVGIVSQNFESTFDAYDAQGADDFKTKKKACKFTTVSADGVYFNGSGPADSFDVVFYKDSGGLPGGPSKSCNGASYSDTGFGSPDIKCSGKIAKKSKVWVSIVANMAFSAGGEWGWNTNNTQRGNPAAWQNPGNGFGSGCTTWGNMVSCIGALGQGPDFSYSIS